MFYTQDVLGRKTLLGKYYLLACGQRMRQPEMRAALQGVSQTRTHSHSAPCKRHKTPFSRPFVKYP
jgi:hypothetical protein|tara:strand:+ start:234 stop:431 length:198 start_codon:yes stop_codon:yes gene_type:complete